MTANTGHPSTIRDVLGRLRELQAVEQHLPPEVLSHRVGVLVDRVVELHLFDPEAFEREARKLACEPFERARDLAATDATTDRLQVLRGPDGYLLRYVAGPSRQRTLSLFAIDTLPLPWTASAPPEQVVADVRRSHPGAYIEEPTP